MFRQGLNGDGEFIRSMFVETSSDHGIDLSGPSRTDTSFADECDVNALMARYEKTGQMIPGREMREPRYLDLSEVPDLHHAMNIMRDAENAFMTLPAGVRREFENKVEDFVRFAEDPENIDQMREWGLAKPAEPTPTPLKVEVVEPQLEPGAGSVTPQAKPGASGTSA